MKFIIFKVLQLLDKTEYKRYSKNVILGIKSLSDKAYSDLRDRVIKDRFVPIVIPPFKSPSSEDVIKALKSLGLKTRYPLKVKIEDKEIVTRPVAVGYGYVIKLEHIGSKKIHSRGVGPYVSKTLAPTVGKRRGGGAYIGEYDMYSLLSYDANTLIDEFFGPLSSDHATKNEMISEIIRTGETEFKESKTNTVREMFVQLMHAILLKSD